MKTILSFLSPTGKRARLSILIWHRVLQQQDAIFPREMHAARFDRVLGWLKQSFNVLPLGEAARRLMAGTLPSRALSITFDDGYEDNHRIALPLLKKHGLCATFFVATGFLDGGIMWNDSVIEIIRRCEPGLLEMEGASFELSDATSRRLAIEELIGKIKYLDFDSRQEAVIALAKCANIALSQGEMMNSDQVRELHQQGMEIGGHTCWHPILSKLSSQAAREEIVNGKNMLEEIIGERIAVFAYPNGVPGRDYTDEHVEFVRSVGFEAAVSTAWGANSQKDDIFQLRRFTPWDETRTSLLLRMGRNLLGR